MKKFLLQISVFITTNLAIILAATVLQLQSNMIATILLIAAAAINIYVYNNIFKNTLKLSKRFLCQSFLLITYGIITFILMSLANALGNIWNYILIASFIFAVSQSIWYFYKNIP